MYLHDFLRPHTSGEGGVGISDAHVESSHEHTTPPISHVSLLSTEESETQYKTPLIPYVSETSSGRCTPNGTEQGVDAEISNNNAQATFLGYSCVTSMGTLETTFLV